MKYIKKVILENFQSHKYTEIELDQYLNVIIGPSDQGKSAIIRAIKWAIYNEPSGDFFIREGEKECSVTVVFNDSTKIKRYRSKSKNVYYIYDREGNETVFEGFGTKVPLEISKKTSMRKIMLDGDQSKPINIGEQLESPFLLSEKNATKANAIGRLVGVHIIDDALKDVLKDIRNLNIDIKKQEEILENLKNSLAKYDYLDDLSERVKQANDIINTIKEKQLRLNKLKELSKRLNRIDKENVVLKDYLNRLKNIDRVIDIERELSNKIGSYNYIRGKYNKLEDVKNQIKYNNRLLASLKNINKIEKIVKLIDIHYNKLNRLININTKKKYVKDNIIKNQELLKALQDTEKLEHINKTIKEKYGNLVKLLNVKNKYDNINKSISLGQIYIEKLKDIDSIYNIKDILEIKINRLETLLKCKKEYHILITKRSDTIKALTSREVEINSYLIQYKQILSKLKICPLCFSTIDQSKIDEIVANYK
ncbi:MAG: AAA family ATPase [Tissierellia bacterium]|nr:AAA family ATPase [Tissierellia bacterium]